MARVIFSTWADSFLDNRGKAPEAQETPSGLPIPFDFDRTKKVAAFMGWAGFGMFDERVNVVDMSRTMKLPLKSGTQLSREAMAVSEGFVHFLPEDLGATNRMFRISLTNWPSGIHR